MVPKVFEPLKLDCILWNRWEIAKAELLRNEPGRCFGTARTSSVCDHFIIWPLIVTLTFSLPDQLFQMALQLVKENNCAILKSMHKCRSYGHDKSGRTDAHSTMHAHTPNWKCTNYVSLTASRFDETLFYGHFPPSTVSRRAVVSYGASMGTEYWLISLSSNSVVRLADRPEMTITV